MRDWEQVIDRYDYKSVGLQVLYFNERAVRFIKITSIGYNFVDISTDIEAIYSTDPLEVDPETTLPIPKYNLFPEMIETDDGNRYDSDCDNDNHEYEHTGDNNLYGNRIVLKLPQPYMIHSVKFWLWEESSYEIEVSTSEEGDWTEVYSERDVSGWRTATFDRQPVMFIKIVGESSDSGYFTLSALQCPAT
uniref:F5/8 type C domain-containing protein n=1 Tax=Panagrellus redivivus TaxID=6233 RepID=A0A7E4ZZ48_PANRE